MLYCVVPSSGHGASSGISTVSLANQCRTDFGGTSAASPILAGVIALMLEANGNLTTRDVQHIIVESAVRTALPGAGWKTNAANKTHHHDFGFGRIDALTTVRKAQSWVNVPPQLACTPARVVVNRPFLAPGQALNATLTLAGCAITSMEQVDLVFYAEHQQRGSLTIELVSPSNMSSTLQEPHDDRTSNYPPLGWRFGTVRNWGEAADGVWTVSVTQSMPLSGVLRWFELRVYGHAGSTRSTATRPTSTPKPH